MLGNYWRAFQPSPEISLAEYSLRSIFNEQSRPFDALAFPHMTAIGGPMDAFDADWIREIVLQMASRLGKTFFGFCGCVYLADLAPCNMLLAGNIEDLAIQNTERVREMAKQVPALADTGLDRTMKRRLQFGGNTIYAAWARSPVTLSNINILFGMASELDLWERMTTSRHPDPEEMYRDRFKDNDTARKEVFESIPTLSGEIEDEQGNLRPRSRIEARRLKGSNCQAQCGCPYCGTYQELQISRVSAAGYKCAACGEQITDQDRKAFLRSIVWVPEGCTVKPTIAAKMAADRLRLLYEAAEMDETAAELPKIRERIRWTGWRDCPFLDGEPTRGGVVASYQLSSLHALSLSWKRIAQETNLESQNFVNQWLGKTVEVDEEEVVNLEEEGRTLATVITGSLPAGQIPDWTDALCLTCDRQKRTFPWQVTATDSDIDRIQVIEYGEALSFDEIDELIAAKYGNRRLSLALIDSGYRAPETYDWCLGATKRHKLKVWPLKGDKASVVRHYYKESPIPDEAGKKAKFRKLRLILINTQSTQEWCEKLLNERRLIKLPAGPVADHQDICEQLLNENEKLLRVHRTWDRISEAKPNDQRDCLRYGYAAAHLAKDYAKKRPPVLNKPIERDSTDIRAVGPKERPVLRME